MAESRCDSKTSGAAPCDRAGLSCTKKTLRRTFLADVAGAAVIPVVVAVGLQLLLPQQLQQLPGLLVVDAAGAVAVAAEVAAAAAPTGPASYPSLSHEQAMNDDDNDDGDDGDGDELICD